MTAELTDQLLTLAFKQNKVASLKILREIAKTRKEFLDIVGDAHLAMLRLEEAARCFKETGNTRQLESVFELAQRHGKYRLVKDLLAYGLKMKGSYADFLRRKALPYLPLSKQDAGFSIDEDVMDAIVSEIGEPREKVMAETVEFMEREGSKNLVKKFIFAHYSKDDSLTKRYEDDFNNKASGGRSDIGRILEKYCQKYGLEIIKDLQVGDHDNYFPSVAHIFLIRHNGKQMVLKENVRLHQNYSSVGGYSMEKEIMKVLKYPNIVKYLGYIETEDIEFLIMEYMPGVTLEKYVKAGNLLPPETVLKIVKTLAEVIGYMHRQNVVSMDIKDKNVMYDGQKATLFDFGVSQIVPGIKQLTGDTFITSLLTTPEYVAPEMALTFKAYPKTDVFQLGVLFYKLLTGKNPFVRRELYDFIEGDEYRESEIIKFVLPTIYRELDESPLVLQANPDIAILLRMMLKKDYRQRPSPEYVAQIIERSKLWQAKQR